MRSAKTLNKLVGVLEQAGLSEFGYYMKKVETYLRYAELSIGETDFESAKARASAISGKIDRLKNLTAEIASDIESLPVSIAKDVSDREPKDIPAIAGRNGTDIADKENSENTEEREE